MQPQIPTFLEIIFVVLTFVLFALIVAAVKSVRQKMGDDNLKSRKYALRVGAVLLIWLAVTRQLSSLHFLDNWSALPPHFLVLIVPPVAGILLLAFSKNFSKFLLHVPAHWLINIQSFRIVMELILWGLFLNDIIGKQMTFEGRNFDVLVGISALILAVAVKRGKLKSKFWLYAWNVAGLILLLNIVIVAILSTPLPFRVFTDGPPNSMIAYFPFVWLPSFVVPVAFAMHVFSIRKTVLSA
ncbi:MAG: hypothetical protein U0073_09140 [Bacteroidia bacterium]